MLGIVVIIFLSWVLLFYFDNGNNLKALGCNPIKKRVLEFPKGILIIIPLIGLISLLDSIVFKLQWGVSTFDMGKLLGSFRYHLISATTEELLFRGAILIILFHKLGIKWSMAISSIAFGVYHIFSYGMLNGNIIPMIYVFFITGMMGLAFSWAYIKSNSILLPLGIHFGWNFFNTLFKDLQPYGEILFTITGGNELNEWSSLFYSLFTGLFPPVALIIIINKIYPGEIHFNSHSRR